LTRVATGPSRGLLYGGADYVAQANETVMAIPMIETAEAVERIEEILDVPGVDMVYVGPNDLAFELDGHSGHPRPKSEAALMHVLIEQGFRLVTPGNDFGHLARSMREAVRVALEEPTPEIAAQNGY